MTVTNTTPPVISGTARQGQYLYTTPGTWTFDLDYLTYAYQWLRCDAAGANCVDIGGATAASYRLAAADLGSRIRSEVTATEVSYPSPPPGSLPLTSTISAGGTYSGTINGSGSATAVTITTSDPVVIVDSTITHSSPTGTLVSSTTAGAQITIRGTTFNGLGPGGKAGRAFYATNWHSILLENNTVNGTWGFRINTPQAGATSVRVSKNRFKNQFSDVSGLHCIQFAEWGALTVGAAEIDWNWMVNEFQKSNMEDPISLFKANGVQVHDNMVDGGYPASLTSNYSGTGTVISDYGGDNNNYFNNTVVACINGGVGISGGKNNHVYNNRIVSDGRDDAGNEFTRANVGLICYTTTPGSNNTMYGNYVGWMQGSGFGHPISRADLYTPTADNNVAADNTWAYGNHSTPMTKADEDAERTLWLAKVAAAGVTIGA